MRINIAKGIIIAMLGLFFLSCSDSNNSNGKQSELAKEKDRMLWMDAEANFELFSKKENIVEYLKKTKDAGFNKVVVDARPVQGDVLYKSAFMPALTEMSGLTVERDWDYLGFFIEEAKKLDMRVAVSTTIFVAGLPPEKSGPAYRDDFFDGKTCILYTKDGMKDVKDDASKVGAFLNPILPEVQDYCLKYIKEIVTNYDIDSYILDYCRYPGEEGDFSEASHKAFEEYIGEPVKNFPADIFTWNEDGTKNAGKHYKAWWEFRSKVIHDFIAKANEEIKSIKPEVELEYWSASWHHALYLQGQNWASKKYDPSELYDEWASPTYKNTGFAEHIDVFQCGAYLERVYGKEDNESIEFALERGKRLIQGDCKMYGSIYAGIGQKNNKEISDAVHLCLTESDGLMVFDIVQVREFNLWEGVKEGVERARADNAL